MRQSQSIQYAANFIILSSFREGLRGYALERLIKYWTTGNVGKATGAWSLAINYSYNI